LKKLFFLDFHHIFQSLYMSNAKVNNALEEYKPIAWKKVLQYFNSLLGHQVLESGESVTVVESEEDCQEVSLKNGKTTVGPYPSPLAVVPDDDSDDIYVGKEGVLGKYKYKKMGTVKCNLIINYLPKSFNENDVMRYFSPFGLIQQCKVVRNLRTGKSKGYGFVKYTEQKSAEAAMRELNGFSVENKRLKIAVARRQCKKIRNSNLYATNLPKTMDSQGLEKLFQPYGKLVECRVLKDKKGRYRGVGFVRFQMHEDAMQALQALNKTRPKGWQKALRVKLAIKRRWPNMDWGLYNYQCERTDWWCGFNPSSPSSRMLPPWSPNPRNSHPSFFGHHVSRPEFGDCGSYSEDTHPYGYWQHPGYFYPPYAPRPGWNYSAPLWDHCGYNPRVDRRHSVGVWCPRGYSSVFVTNLAGDVDETDLMSIFSELNVEKCKVFRSKRGKTCAHIHFLDYKSALDACKFDGRVIKSRAMKIFLKN